MSGIELVRNMEVFLSGFGESGGENPMESRNILWRNGAPRIGAGRWKVKEGVEEEKEEEEGDFMGSK